MKYLYKQTGVVVESSEPLDSLIFTPVTEKRIGAEKVIQATSVQAKKSTRKTSDRTAKK